MKLFTNTSKVGRDRPGLRSFSEVDRARRGLPEPFLQKVAKGTKRLVSARTEFSSGAVFAFDNRKTNDSSFPWLSSVQNS
jgi:hypothetical protein